MMQQSRLWGSSALLAIGISLLVACGNATDATSHTVPPDVTRSTASGSPPVMLTTGQPASTSHAVAKGTPTPSPSKRATPKSAAKSSPSSSGSGYQGSSQAAIDPSGENPPTALSGFTLKYVQDFTGNSIPANWGAYHGTPGGESSDVAQWVPDMCTFSGGEAHFMALGIDSCGLQYYGNPQVYGAWFARLKGDSQPSNIFFSNIFLLFPTNNQWPPEIDIFEDGGDRSRTISSLYNTVGSLCGSAATEQCLQSYGQSNGQSGGVANDDTQWHTYGVEWTPSSVTWFIDGRAIYTAPASQVKSPAQQPAVPMYMDLQSQNLQGTGAPAQRESMTVDWVEEYSWNS
jgi:hypothetical protein